jgi:uncharacterized protein YciI
VIFALIGILKQPMPQRDAAFEAALNAHFAQPQLRIINAGYLRDARHEPIGLISLIETDSFDRARAWLEASPFHSGGFYDSTHIAEYDVEIGRLA